MTLTPRPLTHGSRIAILAPSGAINPQYVHDTLPVLAAQGWVPYVCEHTFGRYHTYAGTADDRYADLETALLDPDTRAILCARGGYGAVHLLDRLDRLPLERDPKWIIGYSDISALHALMSRHGIESIHSPMCSHLSKGGNDRYSRHLFALLRGERPSIEVEPDKHNHTGRATGRLLGGNLAVIADLISTPFNVVQPDTILFIEDIAEPIYKVERIMYQLRLSGVLERLRGLLVGQFTDYAIDHSSGHTMENMIAEMTAGCKYPIAFNFPVGHVADNYPMLCSSTVTLDVTPTSVTLRHE